MPLLKPFVAIAAVALVLPGPSSPDERLTFDADDLRAWRYPRGLVTVGPDGVEVTRFGTTANAVADADSYTSRAIGTFGLRKVRAPSNPTGADRVADQDAATWWQPDAGDPPAGWWVDVDLGRAVVADRIRLVFPDTTGARPFRFFSVFTSPGALVLGSPQERLVFSRVGRPVTDNANRVVDFDLTTVDRSDVSAPYLVNSDTLRFDIVRFVRFEAADARPGGALAEVEVRSVGFNLATRVAFPDRVAQGGQVWGGRTWTSDERECPGCGRGSGADALIDADLARRRWAIETRAVGGWRNLGVWSVVDLGSVFRVDRLVWLPLVAGASPLIYSSERERQCPWEDIEFLTSDGTPSNTADPQVEGPYEYDLLSSVDNTAQPRRFLYDFQFPPRDARLVLWRHTKSGGTCRALQLFIFHSQGYPAQVELESGDVELPGAFAIRRIEWDAELPAGARIEVATRTGNGFATVTRYFLKNGQQVADRAAYDRAKSRDRGDVVDEQVEDATWSGWSGPHRFSGQAFLSPTPRRWLQMKVRLISDDPEVMPKLRRLSLVLTTPVIAGGVSGSVAPREAALDSLTEFRYTLQPLAPSPGDPGFDRVLIALPGGSADVALVSAAVGARRVSATGQLRGDTLVVQLPPPAVRQDPVTIAFAARLIYSPSVFEALVASSGDVTSTQAVNPAEFGADQVFVPEAEAAATLLRDVRLGQVVTPNGDGVHDELRGSFIVLKATRSARVGVYNLGGALVAQPAVAQAGGGRSAFTWDGRASSGRLVPPGIYVVRVRLDADARDESALGVVHVLY